MCLRGPDTYRDVITVPLILVGVWPFGHAFGLTYAIANTETSISRRDKSTAGRRVRSVNSRQTGQGQRARLDVLSTEIGYALGW